MYNFVLYKVFFYSLVVALHKLFCNFIENLSAFPKKTIL